MLRSTPPCHKRLRRCARWAAALAVALVVGGAKADDIKPGLVYAVGDKYDGSFNEAAFRGAEKFKHDTGIDYREVVIANETQLEQAHRRLAQRGLDPIVGIGFSQVAAVTVVAKEFPKLHFTVIDGVVDLPNVQSVIFREHEAAYLVGMLAAMASKSGKIGFVGGMDIPLVRKYACGYEQGARAVTPTIELMQNMAGNTLAAWVDPARGTELARGQFDRGADVIFAAAGTTGLGALQAAKDRGKLAIGVDSNQNHLHPGTVLTSLVKHVDLVTYRSFAAVRDGKFSPGVTVLGLADGALDWALDENNASLITPAMKIRVDQAKADIIAGAITVKDYMVEKQCPP
jgi:basic membrane protein A